MKFMEDRIQVRSSDTQKIIVDPVIHESGSTTQDTLSYHADKIDSSSGWKALSKTVKKPSTNMDPANRSLANWVLRRSAEFVETNRRP